MSDTESIKSRASTSSGTSTQRRRKRRQKIKQAQVEFASSENKPTTSYDIEPSLLLQTSVSTSSASNMAREAGMSESSMNVGAVNSALSRLANEISSEENYRATVNAFLEESSGRLVDWINSTIAFSGFDAVLMRKKILAKVSPRSIMVAVLVGLVRGNNVERISKTMRSSEFTKEFNTIVRTLLIKKNVSGDYSAITLSRMIACFPETVCGFLANQEIPMAVPFSDITAIYAEWPLISRHQVSAGLLPHSLTEDDLNKAFDVILVPYIKTSEIINTRGKEWGKMTASARAEVSSMYLHNSYNSKVLTLSERESLAKKYGIITSSGQLTTVWNTAASHARVWLKKHYSFSHVD